MKKYDTKKLTVTALLIAAAMILSYIESMIPSFAVPGVKIGLANIASVFALFSLGDKEAWGISFVRVLLSGILFGNIASIIYSLTGAVFSLVSMTVMKKTGIFSYAGVSVSGAVFHNAGQIIAAVIVMGTSAVVYYFPVMIVSGVISGIFIGLLSGILTERLKDYIYK